MSAYVKACLDAVTAAGWTGRAAQRLVVDPRADTQQGFDTLLAEANGIRALAKFADRQLQDAGYRDVEGWGEEIVASGLSIADFREDIITALADADQHTNSTPPSRLSGDPFMVRREQVKNLTRKP